MFEIILGEMRWREHNSAMKNITVVYVCQQTTLEAVLVSAPAALCKAVLSQEVTIAEVFMDMFTQVIEHLH